MRILKMFDVINDVQEHVIEILIRLLFFVCVCILLRSGLSLNSYFLSFCILFRTCSLSRAKRLYTNTTHTHIWCISIMFIKRKDERFLIHWISTKQQKKHSRTQFSEWVQKLNFSPLLNRIWLYGLVVFCGLYDYMSSIVVPNKWRTKIRRKQMCSLWLGVKRFNIFILVLFFSFYSLLVNVVTAVVALFGLWINILIIWNVWPSWTCVRLCATYVHQNMISVPR